jgi:hypothetical protein
MSTFPYNTITNFLRNTCWTSLTIGTPTFTQAGVCTLDTTLASNNISIAARNFPLFFEMKITMNYNAASVSDGNASGMQILYQGGFFPSSYPRFDQGFNIPTDVTYVISDFTVVGVSGSTSTCTPYMRVDSNPDGTCNCAISINIFE